MRAYFPSRDDFLAQSRKGNTIPVYARLLSDQLTPVSAYARLASDAEHAFLLESVVGGERIARYSFIGIEPSATCQAWGDRVTIAGPDGERTVQSTDPLGDLEAMLAGRRPVHPPELPRFVGGLVGYAGYDVVRYTERKLADTAPPDDRRLPDMMFALYENMVIFDHVSKSIIALSNAYVDGGESAEAVYEQACRRIDALVERLNRPGESGVGEVPDTGDALPAFTSNFARDEFEAAVEACKEYIRAGDIFQVVLSQRLAVQTEADPFSIYRALRMVNPSPFMFLLKSPAVTLVGSSPEIMCRVEDGVITNRPLAGTRPRGKNEAEDRKLADELLADPKERAEHIMLVDLGRNDVGKVAEPGSIELSDVMAIERYSHVMHICTNVTGKLAEGQSAFDALRATLPVGTVSGAPKVRAMEIIDELEPTRRGPYAGAVGYVDFSGNMDTCIALRTMVIANGTAYVQAGGGIVADSVPANEFQESMNKAKALLRAVAIAEAGFASG